MNKQLRGIKKLNEEELGHYLPAFFFLKIGTKEPLNDLNNLSTEALSTFVHEYVHFLQDIFTPWGLRHITFVVDLLKAGNRYILENGKNEFEVPIIFPPDTITGKNIDFHSIYQGDVSIDYEIDQILEVTQLPNVSITDYEHVTYVNVKVRVKNGGIKHFHFGSHCILESMAYIIQSELFENVNSPKFPYQTVDLMTEFLLPDLLGDRQNLVALCELSLNSYDPGHMFVEILKRMKEESFLPVSPRDIYEFGTSFTFSINGQEGNMAALFLNTSIDTEKGLTDYFTSPSFQPAKDWVESTLNEARKLRFEQEFTFVSLIESKDLKMFIKLVEEIGTPIMSNDNDIHWAYDPNTSAIEFVGLFKAIGEVYNVFFKARSSCDLKGHCRQLPTGDITCDYCDTSPWKMAEKSPLCPFAQIWKTWGLEVKSPMLGK